MNKQGNLVVTLIAACLVVILIMGTGLWLAGRGHRPGAVTTILVFGIPGIFVAAGLVASIIKLRQKKCAAGVTFLAAGIALGALSFAVIAPSINLDHSMPPKPVCINNLRLLDAAKDQYALEHKLEAGAEISWAAVAPYMKDLTNACYCPTAPREDRYFSKNYKLNAIDTRPVCLVSPGTTDSPDHALSDQ